MEESFVFDHLWRKALIYKVDTEVIDKEISIVIVVESVEGNIYVLIFGKDFPLDLVGVRESWKGRYVPDFFDIFEFLKGCFAKFEFAGTHRVLSILFKSIEQITDSNIQITNARVGETRTWRTAGRGLKVA